MQIILNADDFGINQIVTEEIERLIKAGLVSSTTIMANGECLDEVRIFYKEHPDVSFGIHLCLSEFNSITKSKILRQKGLTDEKGQFVYKKIFDRNLVFDESLRLAIREELNAQIDVVRSLGVQISHADSHHHVHTIYPLRYLFAEVLQDRGIKKMRIGSNFHSFRAKAHLGLWIKRVKLNAFYKAHFITADAFYSYSDYTGLRENGNKSAVVELMCHPGHPGKKYRNEIVLVEKKKVYLSNSFELISYNDLY